MDKIQKLLARIPKADRLRLQECIERLFRRDASPVYRQKLKGYEHIFRIRVGNYRIIYFDDGQEIILKGVKRRDESTYSDI